MVYTSNNGKVTRYSLIPIPPQLLGKQNIKIIKTKYTQALIIICFQ